MDVLGECDDQKELHELARLERETRDLNPARAAANVFSEHEHEQKQNHAEPVEHVAEALVVPVVDRRNDRREDATEDDEIDLRDVKLLKRCAHDGCRRIQIHDADHRKRCREQKQDPIEVLEEPRSAGGGELHQGTGFFGARDAASLL